jgi:Cu/Ag efflux protein CusF
VPRIVAAVALALSVATSAGAQQTHWSGVATIMAMLPPPSPLDATRPVVVLDHEPISGLMDERMSMPFIVSSPALFGDLKIGDRVAFELRDTPGALLVVRLDRLR